MKDIFSLLVGINKNISNIIFKFFSLATAINAKNATFFAINQKKKDRVILSCTA